MKRRFFRMLMVVVLVFCMGCGDDASPPSSITQPLLILSDVHFNPFYDPSLFEELMGSASNQWADIFATSAITQPQSWGRETNYPLLLKLLSAVKERVSSSPVVLFPGDILGHKFPETFFELYGKEDQKALRSFVYKTVKFFAEQLRGGLPQNVPVMFVLGNNDSYAGDYRLVPGGEFLADTADLFLTEFLLNQVDAAVFKETYRRGGYFKAHPSGSKVVFLCLNTLLFSRRWSGQEADVSNDAPTQHLNWIEDALAEARRKDQKVWLLMHVPPGADIYATVATCMDKSGHISDAVMMWKPDYQERFLHMVREYADVIAFSFGGHTHMDAYRMALNRDDGLSEPVLIMPSVSPLFGNNPAFKVLSLSKDSWEPMDYRSFAYLFDEQQEAFTDYYCFSEVYQTRLALGPSLKRLYPELILDAGYRGEYIEFYYSGHDAGNPINEINWPAYWCAIGHMAKSDYVTCVNQY